MEPIIFPSRTNAFTAMKPLISASVRNTGGGDGGVKRIKLDLSARPVSAFDPQAELQTLISSMTLLLSSQPTPRTYHSLYTTCQKLVSAPHSLGADLYAAAQKALEDSAKILARELRGLVMARGGAASSEEKGRMIEGVAWVEMVYGRWKAWELCSTRLASVLLYLDRAYVANRDSLQPIRQLALAAFREHVLEERLISEKCLSSFSAWIRADREQPGSAPVEAMQRFITELLILSGSEPFRALHINLTTEHYAHVSLEEVSKLALPEADTRPASDYVNWVLSKLAEEEARCGKLWSGAGESSELESGVGHVDGVSNEVWKGIRKEIEKECVEKHLVASAQQALSEAMNDSDTGALKRLYNLLASVRKFTAFKVALAQHVREHATNMVKDAAHDSTMVTTLLAFKRFLGASINALYDEDDEMTGDVMSSDARLKEERRKMVLEAEVRDGLRAGVESRQAIPAELIAKHLDSVMRKGQGSLTSSGFEQQLDDIVDLVKFTKDKDVFKEFYVAQLAKRLLLGRSASNEEELSMVKKLQREYGEEFTTGDAMMKDLSLSDELNKKYQELLIKNGTGESNLGVMVLGQGAWPQYKQLQQGWEKLALPRAMDKQLESFANWYKDSHSSRIISWRHQHTTVTMTARFPGGNKEIGVSLFQAMVLLQFNDADTLTYEEVYERTGIEKLELIKTLQSLFAQKATRMLLKRPAGPEVLPDHKFTWNSGFTRDRLKFKINQLQQDLSAEESKQHTKRVFEDRVLTLDAQIVRIMKGKKQLKLPELVNETVEAVIKLFAPEVKAIKEQIESLIEREFLERDESDRNLLRYLA